MKWDEVKFHVFELKEALRLPEWGESTYLYSMKPDVIWAYGCKNYMDRGYGYGYFVPTQKELESFSMRVDWEIYYILEKKDTTCDPTSPETKKPSPVINSFMSRNTTETKYDPSYIWSVEWVDVSSGGWRTYSRHQTRREARETLSRIKVDTLKYRVRQDDW